MTHSTFRLAALQIGAPHEGTQATLGAILYTEDEIKAGRPDVLVLSEAVLGGYPKDSYFGTQLGFRRPEGREEFQRYFDEAIDLDGAEACKPPWSLNRDGEYRTCGKHALLHGHLHRPGSRSSWVEWV